MTAIGKRDGDQGAAGALTGVGLAVLLLVVAGSALLQTQGSTPKVLVAVWLWALPVIGIGAGAGWIVGRGGGQLMRGASTRRAAAAVEPDTWPPVDEMKPGGDERVAAARPHPPAPSPNAGRGGALGLAALLDLLALDQCPEHGHRAQCRHPLAQHWARGSGGEGAVEDQTASPGRAVALGVGLAGAAVLGGIGTFLIVWALLVGVVG